MISIVKEFELQYDEKPNGFVIRLNDKEKCILRICQIPKDFSTIDGIVDIVYSDTHPKFIRNIDWDMLREQKNSLILLTKVLNGSVVENINGIIHLLDALQDYAAEDMELGDKKIFNLTEEE